MLLAKMERIMAQKHTLDNHQETEVKSLNFVVRKREMMKITEENLVRFASSDRLRLLFLSLSFHVNKGDPEANSSTRTLLQSRRMGNRS